MNFTQLKDYLDSLPSSLDIPGCDCVIYYQHQPVFRHRVGYADAQRTNPVSGREVYWMYSATKPVTAVAAMQLVERGLLKLEDPVAHYLPAYASLTVRDGEKVRPVERVMTVRDLLTMCGGLTYERNQPAVVEVQKRSGGQATTLELVNAMAKEPLAFEPSTRYCYSFCLDVVAAVIEQAAGQTFGEYLNENIFEPLGMTESGLRMTPARKARLAAQFVYDNDAQRSILTGDDNDLVLSKRYESGGAGLISTVDDYIRFVDMLCGSGEAASGRRILSRESIDLMRTNQLIGQTQNDFDQLKKVGYGYGLGVRTLIDKEISHARSPLGEFGWDSAGGAYLMADPDHRLAVFYAQHVLGCGVAYDVIHPTIRDLTYACLDL